MAKKTTKVAGKPVAEKSASAAAAGKPTGATTTGATGKASAADVAASAPGSVASPAAATTIDSASGAVIEPAIVDGIDMTHPAIDANPRAGTVALQNARDMNDPLNRRPSDPDFVGQGLDPTVYGKKAR